MYKLPIEKAQSQHMRTSKTGKVFQAGSGAKNDNKANNAWSSLQPEARSFFVDEKDFIKEYNKNKNKPKDRFSRTILTIDEWGKYETVIRNIVNSGKYKYDNDTFLIDSEDEIENFKQKKQEMKKRGYSSISYKYLYEGSMKMTNVFYYKKRSK